jgi:NAD(P)-dependent dehydrogenase (short-subunit alcohol dehydrogenase family)
LNAEVNALDKLQVVSFGKFVNARGPTSTDEDWQFSVRTCVQLTPIQSSFMARLQGKRALITGGTSGIGLETARRFCQEGARVAITGLSNASLEAARKELGDVIVIEADAGDAAHQGKVAEEVRKAFGQLDVLFINAGIVELKPLGQWDAVTFDRSFNTNVKGPYFLLQELLPLFANPASIVINGSVNPHIGMPTSSVYAATKAAMISLTKTLSGELISRGIRVNAVSAGPIMTAVHSGRSEKERAALIKQIPAGRFGQPSEIANAVVFLASDEAAFTVGTEVLIDGGMSL